MTKYATTAKLAATTAHPMTSSSRPRPSRGWSLEAQASSRETFSPQPGVRVTAPTSRRSAAMSSVEDAASSGAGWRSRHLGIGGTGVTRPLSLSVRARWQSSVAIHLDGLYDRTRHVHHVATFLTPDRGRDRFRDRILIHAPANPAFGQGPKTPSPATCNRTLCMSTSTTLAEGSWPRLLQTTPPLICRRRAESSIGGVLQTRAPGARACYGAISDARVRDRGSAIMRPCRSRPPSPTACASSTARACRSKRSRCGYGRRRTTCAGRMKCSAAARRRDRARHDADARRARRDARAHAEEDAGADSAILRE